MMTFSNWVNFITFAIIGVFGISSMYILFIKMWKTVAYAIGVVGVVALVLFRVCILTSDISLTTDSVSVPCASILVTRSGEYRTDSEDSHIDDLLNDKIVREVIASRLGSIQKNAIIEIKSEQVKIGLPTFLYSITNNTSKGLLRTTAEIS